jgi:hypothetical protein
MSITIEPTKIKQSFYLLIPKNIAELIDINDNTKFSLKITNDGTKKVLEYYIGSHEKSKK